MFIFCEITVCHIIVTYQVCIVDLFRDYAPSAWKWVLTNVTSLSESWSRSLVTSLTETQFFVCLSWLPDIARTATASASRELFLGSLGHAGAGWVAGELETWSEGKGCMQQMSSQRSIEETPRTFLPCFFFFFFFLFPGRIVSYLKCSYY